MPRTTQPPARGRAHSNGELSPPVRRRETRTTFRLALPHNVDRTMPGRDDPPRGHHHVRPPPALGQGGRDFCDLDHSSLKPKMTIDDWTEKVYTHPQQ